MYSSLLLARSLTARGVHKRLTALTRSSRIDPLLCHKHSSVPSSPKCSQTIVPSLPRKRPLTGPETPAERDTGASASRVHLIGHNRRLQIAKGIPIEATSAQSFCRQSLTDQTEISSSVYLNLSQFIRQDQHTKKNGTSVALPVFKQTALREQTAQAAAQRNLVHRTGFVVPHTLLRQLGDVRNFSTTASRTCSDTQTPTNTRSKPYRFTEKLTNSNNVIDQIVQADAMTKHITVQNGAPVDTAAFPEAALLPKQETGVQSFLAKHPTFDGRGAVIAIFDSGIDPRAAGLQVTSDGKPKVIQLLDGSGSGDVDMRTQVTPENGVVTGISGRILRIPSTWKNPSGKYRIGLKAAFDLYPTDLKERMQKDYKEKNWSALLQPTLAETTKKLQQIEADLPNDKAQKEELEARVDVLMKMDKNYADLGPVYDCLLWHDGTSWKAVIDTSEEGALDKCEVVGPYAETLHVSTLSNEDNFSYSVNVHDDGDILEIVTSACCHGTHVASIAAANFPDNPARNGVAPGAQIISIRLADIRVGTMETGTSMYRAMAMVMKYNVDVINMSYGECSKWCRGRIWEYFEEMISKRGVTMMVSAGNKGPALSTMGTPPTQSAIGVGAVVTPHMMEAEYSLREKNPTIGYNWTSRGPAIDGRQGVTFCAPGAAITSVPTYTLQGSALKNGTSMAAPNAAGVATLLVSALKQSNMRLSPYLITRALKNSSYKFASYDPFTHGQGLIQVERAWEWLQATKDEKENLLNFEVKADQTMRGVYLREPVETSSPQLKVLHVQPIFVNEKKVAHDLKTSYDQHFTLVCDAPWVQAPSFLNMMYQERTFSVKVDPSNLEENQSYFTQIEAFECGKPDKGPVFQIPISVIKPKRLPANTNVYGEKIILRPGGSNRCFLAVPSGATWCLIKMKSLDSVAPGTVLLQTVQLYPDATFEENSFEKRPVLQPLGEASYAFKVLPDRTLEICLSKWWTSFGDLPLEWSVQFFGLTPNGDSFNMSSGQGLYRVDVRATLGPEEMNPSVSLKHHVIVLRPAKSKISPGGTRDIIPEGRVMHVNTLTYNLNLAKGGDTTISLPLLCNYLYESEFCSQLWMLYDANKQLLASGDAFPDKYVAKLEKGEYTIMAQVRHEDRALLEKVTQDLPLHVAVKLNPAINLDVYGTADQGLIQGKKISSACLPANRVKPFYVGHVPSDKMPKGVAPGHFLLGSLVVTADEQGKSVATFPFKYHISELGSKKKGGDKEKENGQSTKEASKESAKDSPKVSTKESGKDSKEKKTPEEEFEEAACDFCAQQLSKGSSAVDAMYQELIKRNPQANQLILAKIQALLKKEKDIQDSGSVKSKLEETSKQIISLAEQILVNVNPEKLLQTLGCRQDKSDQAACKQVDKQKQLVVDVLTKKGEALFDLYNLKQSADDRAKIEELFTELQRWVDPLTDVKTASFVEQYLCMNELYGKAAKLLLKVQEDKPSIETENKLLEVYKKLGWSHAIKLSERHRLNKFAPIYRAF